MWRAAWSDLAPRRKQRLTPKTTAAVEGRHGRQRGRLLQREGDPGAPGDDPAGRRRAAGPAHRPPAPAGVDLSDGARLRRRPPPPLRRPRAVPAVGGLRRADRLLLHPAARHRRAGAGRHAPAGRRALRLRCSARSTSSTLSTSASPRSTSTNPEEVDDVLPRSSAREEAAAQLARALPHLAQEAAGARWPGATATASTRSPSSSPSSPSRIKAARPARATCSRRPTGTARTSADRLRRGGRERCAARW